MGRGLSPQQKEILDLLPRLSDHKADPKNPEFTPMRTKDIREALGLPETASNRASVSRSISRLYDRGLILHQWGWLWPGENSGCGYALATPEEVAEWREGQQKFLEAYGMA